MTIVRTAHGDGRIVDTETVRGHTRHKVAGVDFEVWMDATEVDKRTARPHRGVTPLRAARQATLYRYADDDQGPVFGAGSAPPTMSGEGPLPAMDVDAPLKTSPSSQPISGVGSSGGAMDVDAPLKTSPSSQPISGVGSVKTSYQRFAERYFRAQDGWEEDQEPVAGVGGPPVGDIQHLNSPASAATAPSSQPISGVGSSGGGPLMGVHQGRRVRARQARGVRF
jgi:hypothetical protein